MSGTKVQRRWPATAGGVVVFWVLPVAVLLIVQRKIAGALEDRVGYLLWLVNGPDAAGAAAWLGLFDIFWMWIYPPVVFVVGIGWWVVAFRRARSRSACGGTIPPVS